MSSQLLPLPWLQLLRQLFAGLFLVACLLSREDFVSLCSLFLSALLKLFVGSFL